MADQSEDATLPMAEKASITEKAKVAAETPTGEDVGVMKKRKWAKAKPSDGDEAGNDVKVVSKNETEGKVEAKAEPKIDDKVEPVKAAMEATPEPKREKRVRLAARSKSQIKADPGVETGSLPKKTDDGAYSLAIAERALASAERAAAAAERAADAAERAVAASQARSNAITAASPAVTAPAASTP